MVVANALVTGWSNTFPEVSHYQKEVVKKVESTFHVTNMCGRVYYLSNTEKAYKLGNYNVQGSCADELKSYLIKINNDLRELKVSTKALANIHDELQFSVYQGEEWIYPRIKEIMETVEWMKVPVVVDLEITDTNWAEKYEAEIA